MTDEAEVLVSEQVLQVPFNYSAGPVASRALVALRDEGKFLAIKCAKCGKVYMPPRAVCGGCGVRMEDWVEVGPQGTLQNFTVVHYAEPVHPKKAPFALGIILLDGADTGLVHVVRAGEQDLKKGMRLKPVMAKERRGHILDVECFEPAS